jgi:tight adherence protein C
MNQLFWWVSLGVFVLTWISVSALVKKLATSPWREEWRSLREGVQDWPPALRWLSLMSFPLRGVTQGFCRESAAVKSALRVLAAPVGLTDLVLARIQLALLIWTLVVGSLLLALMYWSGSDTNFGLGGMLVVIAAALGFWLPQLKLFELLVGVKRKIGQALPNFLDVLALTLESGQNFQSAIHMAVERLPVNRGPGLREQLEGVLRSMRSGDSRSEALQKWSDRLGMPEVTQFVASVVAADRQGVSVVGLLRRQSQQLRISRALAAERHAMKMPVKLLAPLAICIFPCTFLILAFPLAIRLTQSGLF